MKIRRQNISEEYSTTVDWIKDFSGNLGKNANFLETLRNRHYNKNVFSSIEEKMADIKNRVGFDLVANSNDEPAGSVVTAGCSQDSDECSECSSGNKCPCSDGFKEEHVALVEKILDYIRSKATEEPDLPGTEIVSSCILDAGGFSGSDDVSLNIDALINYANDLSKKSREDRTEGDSGLEYIKHEPSSADDGAYETADYYNHANP